MIFTNHFDVSFSSLLYFVDAGIVKKCGTLKIVHEKYKKTRKVSDSDLEEFHSALGTAVTHNKELANLVKTASVSGAKGNEGNEINTLYYILLDCNLRLPSLKE